MEYISIPEARIPLIMKADVVVVGGGPAGVGAAVRAAQHGADTVLIERFGSPGGVMTNGLMCINVREPLGGLHTDIFERLSVGDYIDDPLEKYPNLSSSIVSLLRT